MELVTLLELLVGAVGILLLLAIGYLVWKLEEARAEIRELQAERVADVKWAAGLERRTAEVDRNPPLEQAAAERLQKLDESISEPRAGEALSEEKIMEVLRQKAADEGRKVSDSVLREDARRIRGGFSKSGQPPGV